MVWHKREMQIARRQLMILAERESQVRCCFIQLYSDLQPANAEPLSIEKLSSALANSLSNISTKLYTIGTFQVAEDRIDIVREIIETKYDLIGLSCPQGTNQIAHEILSLLYIHNPPQIVLGHALPTILPEYFLFCYPRSFIVRGWGEDAIIMLCRQFQEHLLQPELVPGLTYLDEQGIRHDNPPAWSDPAFSTQRITPERYFARVEASRGCHYNVCTFCSRPPRDRNQPPWKRVNTLAVLAEIENLVLTGITTFTFTDEDFVGNDPHGALELAKQLRNFPDLDFALSVRIDNIFVPTGSAQENQLRWHIFQTLKEAGLTLIFVGIESFSPTQLQRFGKGVSPETNIKVLHLLESLDIELEVGCILFDPLATIEELHTNIKVLQDTGFWRYAGQIFSFLRPQVGTPYVTLLQHHHLLGPLQVNTAEYSAMYRDHGVAQIAQYCKAWNKKYNHLYMLLRNSCRSDLGTGYFKQSIERYRSLQLNFLETLLADLPEKAADTLPDARLWQQKMADIAQDICFSLQSRLPSTAAEKELLQSAARLVFAEDEKQQQDLKIHSMRKV
jgi:radical SAM superfamily enzyme YgiQ (UPF0313 family)